MANKIIILDGDNLSHRSYHAMKNMKFGGKSVSVIFGFLNILGGLCGRYKPSKIYICWDGDRHKERLKLHPNYKLRDKKLGFDYKDFNRQKEQVRKLANSLGIPQIYREGREADDYIYALAERIQRKTSKKVIIASGDKDFYQMVNKRCYIHNENKGLITPLNIQRIVGVPAHQFVDYLSLMGDKSDNIPGVAGYGEKTALKFLKEWESISKFAVLGFDHPHYDKVIEGVGLSAALIDLKWFHENKIKEKITSADYYKEDKKPKRNEAKYKKRCAKWGIRKFATDQFISQIP